MTWVMVLGLALVVFAIIAFVFRVPRQAWEVVGAALMLGIAGYALQGSPRVPAAPKAPAEATAKVTGGEKLSEGAAMGDRNMIVADAFARRGQYAAAAEVLRGAVAKDPNNAEAWLTMGNALVSHAEGTVSPAAVYAYGRAAQAAPDSAGPPFFLGYALIRSGRIEEGRKLWADLLARSPMDAPWRADLEKRLGELDGFLAQQAASAR